MYIILHGNINIVKLIYIHIFQTSQSNCIYPTSAIIISTYTTRYRITKINTFL